MSKALAWLKESFDPIKYPWFGEGFLHPADFPSHIGDAKIIQPFEGFVDP